MDKKDRQTFSKAMSYKNSNAPAAKKPVPEKPDQLKLEFRTVRESTDLGRVKPKMHQESFVSAERLQEAIIWSEILGKPVSRRRKRR